MSDSVLNQPLVRHPAVPGPVGLTVTVDRLPADDPSRPLRLRYRVAGDPAALRWPAPLAAGEAARQDGLWRHTCFEAFLGLPAAPAAAPAMTQAVPAAPATGYLEFNFAPSGAWAAYRFDGYRAGMRAEALSVEPRIALRHGAHAVDVEVAIAWPALPAVLAASGGPSPMAVSTGGATPLAAARRLRLGLTAVLEAADGSLSYWALRHPAERPDFHNDGGFQLEVEVPG